LVPLNDGRPKAGSLLDRPDGGEMLYVNVPVEAPVKLNENVPTRVCWRLLPGWKNGVPFST